LSGARRGGALTLDFVTAKFNVVFVGPPRRREHLKRQDLVNSKQPTRGHYNPGFCRWHAGGDSSWRGAFVGASGGDIGSLERDGGKCIVRLTTTMARRGDPV
jgi:hypothetical protein